MPEFPVLKDIVERPEPVDYLPWIVTIGGTVVVLAVLAIILLPKWLRERSRPHIPSPIDAADYAIDELNKLNAGSPAPSPEIASRVQYILRTYLHRRHGALGLYRTADELLGRDTPGAPPSNPNLAHFSDVLREAEGLRYGRQDSDGKDLIVTAIAALEADSSPPQAASDQAEP